MSLSSEILAISQLRGYWKLDEGTGTSVADSANGHTGTATGVWYPGLANHAGKALHGSVSVAHHADFNVSAAWSLLQCVRFFAHEFEEGQPGAVFSGFPSPNPNGSMNNSGYTPDIRVYAGNTVCVATGPISDLNGWHLLIETWNGTTAKIWIDGVDVSGSTTAPSPAFADGTDPLTFTASVLAHNALYGKALSPTEVSTLTTAFNAEKTGTNLPTFAVGIHQDLDYDGTAGARQNSISTLRGIHATYSRNTILWHLIEPTQGNFDWTRHDSVMNELDARGMKMHAVIASSPTWANGGVDTWQVPGTGVDASFNTWLSLYTGFVTTFCQRYLGRIHRYELWNEPNLLGFWNNASSAVDPTQYRAWHNAVRSAILAVDPSAEICFGGLASWKAVGGSDQSGETFFRNCMAAGAMTIDHMAYHPYVDGDADPNTWTNGYTNTFYGCIRNVRDVLVEFGYNNTDIWLTEFGWVSSGGANTETTQRDRLQHGLEGIRDSLRDIADLAIVFIDWDQGSFVQGLYSNMPSDGSPATPKLAAAMFSTFAAPFDVTTNFDVAVATWSSVRNR